MSEYGRLDPVALDRWITGNYGEDQFTDEDEWEEVEDPRDPDAEYEEDYEYRNGPTPDPEIPDAHLDLAYEMSFDAGSAALDS